MVCIDEASGLLLLRDQLVMQQLLYLLSLTHMKTNRSRQLSANSILRTLGWTTEKAAAAFGVCRQTIWRWHQPRSVVQGTRRQKLNNQQKLLVTDWVLKNPLPLQSDVIEFISTKFHVSVSQPYL